MNTDDSTPLGTVVICTALNDEYHAVREHLTEPSPVRAEGSTLYEEAIFPTGHGHWIVVLTQTSAGNTQAAVHLDRAVTLFRPQIALFVGVAGGVKDVKLGDVVIADYVYDYEAGKDTAAGYRPWPKGMPASPQLVQRARELTRTNEWQHRILPAPPEMAPAALVKPIAAGGKVVADGESSTAASVREHRDDAVAVEMEGHGFLYAAYVNNVAALVVRGISDLLTDKTEAADRHWQPVASRHAAAFAFELLDRLPPRHDIQRQLATGSTLGGLTAETLRGIVADSVSNATLRAAAQTIQVGEGAPGNRATFVEAYRRAGGEARLGSPTSPVVQEGPGFVQHFVGGDGEKHAVLCALPGASAVAIAGSVWDALAALPGTSVMGVHAAGFPLARQDAPAAELIDYVGEDTAVVNLDGGSWGRGQLVRDRASGQWRWQPNTRLLMEASLSRQIPPAGPADVTVRAVAALPWNTSQDGWEITKGGRQRLLRALSRSEVSNAATLLSRWRGAMIMPPEWERPSGTEAHQSGNIAHYRCVLWAPDGQPAVTTTARLHLPTGRQSSITTCLELQINLVPWRSVLTSLGIAADVDLRLTAGEVAEFWAAAWDAATMVAPIAVVDDPSTMPLLAPPRVELQVKVNEGYDGGLGLADVLDLSVFGEPTGDPAEEGAVTIIAPIGYDRARRLEWTATALTRLARAWTFVDAEERDLVQALR